MNVFRGVVVWLGFGLLAAGAQAQKDPTMPPAGVKPVLTLNATGFQIYTCSLVKAQFVWNLMMPQAKLFDQGVEAGVHSAGPTWTLKNGSSVKGQMIATKASRDARSVPWLLLKAVDGKGTLAGVRYIRRSETSGGQPHATGCSEKRVGAVSPVPYKATYTFYGAAK